MPFNRHGFALVLLLGPVVGAIAADPPPAAGGREIHGVTFAPSAQVGEHTLVLRGAGLLRYLRLVPVYAAALYVDPAAREADPLGDYAKRLEVEYLVAAPAQRFNDAGARALQGALSPEAWAALRPRFEELSGWYPDPKPGDRCALTYTPGIGTQLSFNGRLLGTIAGEDFQRAYFQIWLGEEPASESLRDALLSTKPARGGRKGAG